MRISRECKLVCGLILLLIPTIMYGGITLLGVLTDRTAGYAPEVLSLNETQWALWRAGHAHAGVWTLLSLVIQLLLDAGRLPPTLRWTARVTAPLAALAVSGGFFGLAFFPAFQWLLYSGGLCLVTTVLLTAMGLLRNLNSKSV